MSVKTLFAHTEKEVAEKVKLALYTPGFEKLEVSYQNGRFEIFVYARKLEDLPRRRGWSK